MDEKSWQEPEIIEEPLLIELDENEGGEQEQKPAQKEKNSWQKAVLTYLHDLAYLLAGLILVFLLLFRVVVVSGESMQPTLYDGDYLLLLNNIFYNDPQSGDVVVVKREGFVEGNGPIVKRVIATEGQWVDIDFEAGVVYVGDTQDTMVPLDEPYTLVPTTRDEGTKFPLQVDPGCIFLLGDNRDNSADSRSPRLGQVSEKEVLGKVIFLFLPGDAEGEIERDFGRIGVVD